MSYSVAALITLYVVGTMLSGIMEQTYFGGTEAARLTVLMTEPSFSSSFGFLGTTVMLVDFAWEWLVNLWSMLWWDYAFFQGQWLILKYAIFIPISIKIITGVVAMMRGTSAE